MNGETKAKFLLAVSDLMSAFEEAERDTDLHIFLTVATPDQAEEMLDILKRGIKSKEDHSHPTFEVSNFVKNFAIVCEELVEGRRVLYEK